MQDLRIPARGADEDFLDANLDGRMWALFLQLQAWMVLIACVVGAVVGAALQILTPWWMALLAAATAVSATALVTGDRLRRTMASVLPIAYTVVGLGMWAYGLYVHGPALESSTLLLGIVLWFPFVYALAFFNQPPGRALVEVLATVTLLVAIAIPHAVQTRAVPGPFNGLVLPLFLLLSQPLLAVALYVFARLEPALRRSRSYGRLVERLARVDALTGIANRLSAEAFLQALLEGAPGTGGAVTLLLFDVDRFKRINDVHGHSAGDEVLRRVANALQEGVRQSDLAARWGGEEFLVVAPGTDADEAVRLAERLRAAVAAVPLPDGVGGPDLTISCGIALARPGEVAADLVARADRALYDAKRAGRDRVEMAAVAAD